MHELYKKFMTLDGPGRILVLAILLMPFIRLIGHPNTGLFPTTTLYHSYPLYLEILIITSLIIGKKAGQSFLLKYSRFFWSGFALWAMAAVWGTQNAPEMAFALSKNMEFLIHLVFALALFDYAKTHPQEGRFWILGIIFSFLIFFPPFLASTFYIASGTSEFDWSQDLPAFSNVRHFNFVLGITITGLGLLPATYPELLKRFQFPYIAILTLCWMLMFWTGGRGPALATFGALSIGIFLVSGPQRKSLIWYNVASIILGALLSLLLPIPNGSYGLFRFATKITEVDSINKFSAYRITVWLGVLEQYVRHPWIGFGPNQTKFLVEFGNGFIIHPHNVVLQALLAWGLIGGLPFLGAIIGSLGQAYFRLRAQISYNEIGLAGFGMAMMLFFNAMLDSTLYHPFTICYFVICLSVALIPAKATDQSASSLERA